MPAVDEATTVEQVAVRHPKRGQAHRPTKNPHAPTEYAGMTACGRSAVLMTEHLPVRVTAPEDRCKRCWPGV